MQQGKSSFIKLLHLVAEAPLPEGLLVGKGNEACTKEISSYPLTIPSPTGSSIRINIVDTPGLSENTKLDDDYIFHLIKTIRQVPSLGAIVFVIKNGVSLPPNSPPIFNIWIPYLSLFKRCSLFSILVGIRYVMNPLLKWPWLIDRLALKNILNVLKTLEHFS